MPFQQSVNPQSLYGRLLAQAAPQSLRPRGAGQAEGLAQMQLLQQMATPGGGFAPIAEQARQQFETKTLPGLARRYGGGRGSSAFDVAATQAGADLELGLGALGGSMEQQRMGQLSNFLQGQQQTQQRQQQIGQQGLFGAGQQMQQFDQATIQQILQQLTAQMGLGGGQGDTIKDQGALMPILQMLTKMGTAGLSGGTGLAV